MTEQFILSNIEIIEDDNISLIKSDISTQLSTCTIYERIIENCVGNKSIDKKGSLIYDNEYLKDAFKTIPFQLIFDTLNQKLNDEHYSRKIQNDSLSRV